jgi:nitrogen regulatory protein P-II 1
MKEIKAIVQPHMVGKVMEALHALKHFPGATVTEVSGHGRGRGAGGQYQATLDTIYPKRKTRIEVVCDDASCDTLVKAIQTAAHTGNAGDGVVWVNSIDRVVRIRTGVEQEDAV